MTFFVVVRFLTLVANCICAELLTEYSGWVWDKGIGSLRWEMHMSATARNKKKADQGRTMSEIQGG